MLVIYGNSLCSFCRRAKKLAEQYQIDFEYRDTDIEENLNRLRLEKPDAKTIPQIWWHGKYIGGYDDFAAEVENTRGFGHEPF